MSEQKKFSLGISASVKEEEVTPELKVKDNIDENQDLEIKISKDKVYAEYELRF